ncbi:MAG: ABC transporter ATP-binding protein [Bacilli bacterium]|nr:ABC transporter ATP-binding protein [Bacilli bacterium]
MKNAYQHVWWFIKQEYKKYIVVGIVLVMLSIMLAIPAKILGVAIDEIVASTLTPIRLVVLALGLFLFPLARYLLNIFYHYNINQLGHKLSFNLRENYINHLFELDAAVYEKYTKGDLISRATNDLQNLTALATNVLQTVVFNFGVLITAIVMMVMINPLLTLASIIIMPFSIFWLNKKRAKKREYYKIHHEVYGDMTEKVLESIEGVKAVRAYGQEENDFQKTKVAIDKDIESWWKILKFESIYGPLFELVYAFCYFVGIAFGSYMVITSQITPGELVTFLIYVGMLYGPLIALSNVLNTVNNIIISDQRYFEIMDMVPSVKDHEEAKEVFDFKSIEFKNVSFQYPFDSAPVIKNITFTINKGETIGIVGPTGAGKSTLIRQLLREFNITSGTIEVDGVNINDLKIEGMHDLVGYVPQDHILFRRSVDDNILIGKPNATIQEVNTAIMLADFKKDLKELPDGSETMVAELGGSLSGGQRQRLSIARALVKNPKILILDDSLSAVDAMTEANIIASLKEARSEETNIIVAHRFSAVAKADKIIVLQNGTITDVGTHTKLLSYDNWYKMQYLKQIKGDTYE